MKSRNLRLFILSILTIVLLVGLTSAAVDFTTTDATQTVEQGNTATVTFTVTEDGHGDLTNISFNAPLTLTLGSNTLVSANTITGAITTLNTSETSTVMSLTFTIPSNQAIGDYTGNLTLSGEYITSVDYDLPITITVTTPAPTDPQKIIDDFEGYALDSDFYLDIDKVKVIEGYGKDEEWFPFDEVEITIDVDNRFNNDDIDDLEISWGLYDADNDNWYIDDSENDFTLRDGRDDTITVSFILEDNIDELENGDWTFYVWATGRLDDSAKTRIHAEIDSKSINLEIENDFVILDNVKFDGTATCGETVRMSGDVWNIGDDDQNDVFVKIYNNELGINEWVDIGELNAFDDDSFSLDLEIPSNAESKEYFLELTVYDDDEPYENDYDDDLSQIPVSLSLEGCTVEPEVLVAADLVSDAKSGKEMVVKAIITNTGSDLTSYDLRVTEYTGWASAVNVDVDSFTLSAGGSQEVMITFNVNKGVEGYEQFDIEVLSGSDLLADQQVEISIEKGGVDFSGVFGDNWYLWGIGFVNIILVIIIIVVAVRVARK